MPIHDFLCHGCGELFEALIQSSADEDRNDCPACGSDTVSRQIVSRVSVRTRVQRRGGVVDLSSGQCPCSAGKHAHH